jgi:hypothetical protein
MKTEVTVSLPARVLQRFKVFAATRETTISTALSERMSNKPARRTRAEEAERRFLDRIQNAPGRGIGGRITWSRDELHER